jgi:hypothetical protein
VRFIAAVVGLGVALSCYAQRAALPDAPQAAASYQTATGSAPDSGASSSSEGFTEPFALAFSADGAPFGQSAPDASRGPLKTKPGAGVPVDANGNPIPLERQQPKRILGLMPNFRSVSGGAKPHPPGWKYNFTVATHQATDYSTFVILGLNSLLAEGENEHSVLGKGVSGFYAYTWRGFLDKTDGTYLSAWLLPSILHEDTRYYALGAGHPIWIRTLYVISRQGVARTYGGRQTPNIAGIGGKVLTQVISRTYYPPSASTFSVLATKFGYSVMRDVMNSTIREFYPDVAAHFIRRH